MARILNAIAITIAIGALFGVLFLRLKPEENMAPYIIAGDRAIPVSIADTQALREKGLSGTESLAAGTGKLFVFDAPGVYSFWMKDMKYPIDIVWIDSSWRVVDITSAAAPESYPTLFSPHREIQYVLEINANEAAVDNLSVGAQLQLKK